MDSGEQEAAPAAGPAPTGNRLLRNSAFNLAGVVLPALVAIATTPPLIAALGVERFGIFSLQLALLVLLGINDFGISRAVVLVAVERGGFDTARHRAVVVGAGLSLLGVVSIFLASIGLLLVLADAGFGGNEGTTSLASWGFVTLASAISLPTLPLRAGMEVEERFGVINLLRAVTASLLFLAPLLTIQFAPTLSVAALGLLGSRVLALAMYSFAAGPKIWVGLCKAAHDLMVHARQRRLPPIHAQLVRRGGWLGAAGTTSILLSYVDRFALGLLLGAASVTEYVVAAELATKLWLVIGAIIAAATPRLAKGWPVSGDPQFPRDLLIATGAVLVVTLLSHCLFLFSGERMLQLWLGTQFRPGMTDLLRILSVGIAINALSNINSLLLVIGGRERATAFVQFVSLPLMALAALIAARWFGPVGVAWAVAGRLLLDLFWIKYLLMRGQSGLRAGLPYWLTIGWVAMVLTLYYLS